MPLSSFDPSSLRLYDPKRPGYSGVVGEEFSLPQLRSLARGLGFERPEWCSSETEREVLVGFVRGVLDELAVHGVCVGEFITLQRES